MNDPGNQCRIQLPDAQISYYPSFLDKEPADIYYKILLEKLDWKQHSIRIFGKKIPQPRLTGLYALNEKTYTYSNLSLTPAAFTGELSELQQRLREFTGIEFTHCLANFYRSGSDSMGWHADDEKELGKNPVIASLSFGSRRKFQLKHKTKSVKHHMELEHGSLLLMAGATQHYWKHQLPKTKKETAPRINLTFRKIL